jgi:hypothetical protein
VSGQVSNADTVIVWSVTEVFLDQPLPQRIIAMVEDTAADNSEPVSKLCQQTISNRWLMVNSRLSRATHYSPHGMAPQSQGFEHEPSSRDPFGYCGLWT